MLSVAYTGEIAPGQIQSIYRVIDIMHKAKSMSTLGKRQPSDCRHDFKRELSQASSRARHYCFVSESAYGCSYVTMSELEIDSQSDVLTAKW